jgi:hypothetical protein
MASGQLEALQLNREQVEIAADFFEAYAEHALSLTERENDSEASLMDAASSLRVAGQWAMLLDPRRAANLLGRSADLWNSMEYGFGTFLLTAFAPRRVNRDDVIRRINEIARLSFSNGASRDLPDEDQSALEPLRHPQQQAYLLLAAASMARRLDLPSELLRGVLEQSPHSRGVVPVGALGTPIRTYWSIAKNLLGDNDEETAALVASDLAGMAAAYAEAIDSAMANERLWFNAAAPVDAGDTDTTAIALIAAQRLGSELTQAHLREAMEDLRPVARVPLELASEMIEASPQGLDDRL